MGDEGCTAKFTTLTPTDDVVARARPSALNDLSWTSVIPDNQTVTRRGDRLMRDDVQCPETGGPHQCVWEQTMADKGYVHPKHLCECGVVWEDGWHGSTPHTDPAPCPDCERGKVRRGFFDVPCPSCGGSGTRPVPYIKCPNDEPHEGHQYAIRADGITVAGGYCSGTRPNVTDAIVPMWALERAIAYVDEPCRRDHHGRCQTHDLETGDCYLPALKDAAARARQENP